MSKLNDLSVAWGMSVNELLAEYITDSVAPGICRKPGCDYTTEVEPDCTEGYCECCGTGTVVSGLILAGVI